MYYENLGYDTAFIWKGEKLFFNSKSKESVARISAYMGMKISMIDGSSVIHTPDFVIRDRHLQYTGDYEKPMQPIGLKDFDYLFCSWWGEYLDLSHWETSDINSFNGMFLHCSNLEEINISNWNTRNVTGFSSMFSQCKRLKSLDLNAWDTSSLWSTTSMFRNCKELQNVSISNWDVHDVAKMSYMFYGCECLQDLDIREWSVQSTIDLTCMFKECKNLTGTMLHEWAKKQGFRDDELEGIFEEKFYAV